MSRNVKNRPFEATPTQLDAVPHSETTLALYLGKEKRRCKTLGRAPAPRLDVVSTSAESPASRFTGSFLSRLSLVSSFLPARSGGRRGSARDPPPPSSHNASQELP